METKYLEMETNNSDEKNKEPLNNYANERSTSNNSENIYTDIEEFKPQIAINNLATPVNNNKNYIENNSPIKQNKSSIPIQEPARPSRKKNKYNVGLAPKGTNSITIKQMRIEEREAKLSTIDSSSWYTKNYTGLENNTDESKFSSSTQYRSSSPTRIKYKFVQPENYEIRSSIFKVEKKCIVM